MKIIRSFCLVSFCLSATALLQAQDVTTKAVTPPAKSTIPSPDTKSTIAPELKPETKVASKGTTVDANSTTPSPLTRDETNKMPGGEKPTFKVIDNKDVATPANTENMKTLSGTSEKPKPRVMTTSTIDQHVKPPAAKPVNLKKQQNQ